MVNDKEIVQSDKHNLYLGNLRTVEFDLDLPTKGANGSTISWETSDERFLKADGKVTRPTYGRGNRVVTLTATLTHGDFSEKTEVPVTVLEEDNDIKIAEIFPVRLTHEVGESFYLPQAIAVKTETGSVLPQYVEWDDGEKKEYNNVGQYVVHGHIKASEYKVEGQVIIKEHVDKKLYRPKVVDFFPLKDVRLTAGSPVAVAQQRRLDFLKEVNDDQMLYNFRAAAGLDTKGAPQMIGWDTPDSLLRGHTTGHYLSALAQAYGATSDPIILKKLNYMIDELGKVQDAFVGQPGIHEGFLSAYDEKQFDLLEEFTPYPQIWAPYYTLHKILAGLIDAYRFADSEKALDIATKIGHWVYNRLSRLDTVHMKQMWAMYIAGEIGGINESLATLGEITGNSEFIKTAQFFDNDKLFFPMLQHVDALGSLHANQHIPQIVGAITLYDATSEDYYYQIANFFWQSVTGHHIYSFGGTGDGEMFHQPDQIASKINENSAESCASYNMIKLTTDLFRYDPTVDKMDYYENTLLNHILSSTDHEGLGASTYFMPTEPGAQKGFDDENSCCHGTGLESQFKYGEAIYAESDESIIVNLLLASRLNSESADIEIISSFDTPEKASIKINKLTKKLSIRQPEWSQILDVTVNELEASYSLENGYLTISGLETGDVVELSLDPRLHLIPTPDNPGIVSVAFGPFILAALSDSTDYIDLNITSENELADKMIQTPGKIEFKFGEVRFVPFYAVNHEHYSVYFRLNEPVNA